jgi:outer membrane receptor protein involved in Fe transport
LPAHATADLSAGRQLTRALSAKLTATNISNDRYLIDRANTFGGTHYALPRRISLQLRYRFGGSSSK